MAGTKSGFLARAFLGTAIAYGIAGIALGLAMAMSKDHGQMPTHAHINVIGFLSFFLFALFHAQWGSAVSGLPARIHFWLAQAGMLGLTVGLYLTYGGATHLEAIPAISAMIYAASFLVFAVAAWPVLRKGS